MIPHQLGASLSSIGAGVNGDCSMANSQLPTEPVLSVVEGNNELTMNYQQPTTIYANRRNTPKAHRPTNKPPIQPKLSTNYDSIITNKANLPDDQMNINKVLTKDYENKLLRRRGKNKANSKPNKAN